MKTYRIFAVLGLLLAPHDMTASAAESNPSSPSYRIVGESLIWSAASAAAASGNSTSYHFDATIGQTAAGGTQSESYSLSSGFWEDYSSGCCVDRVGDANGSGEDEPTIGDVTTMIDAKFIASTCDGIIDCLEEADMNQSATGAATCEDITIGDITSLIDYLFITGPSLGLPNCL
ncbi:MAG: hypothetical protein AB1772_08425 [Candidatus Zixiibacteriota bacterium]